VPRPRLRIAGTDARLDCPILRVKRHRNSCQRSRSQGEMCDHRTDSDSRPTGNRNAACRLRDRCEKRLGNQSQSIFCPNCNAQIPQVRHPQNVRQTLWGGSYCPQCGAEVDKWGRLLQAPSPKRALSAREPFVPMSRRRLLLLASVPFFCMALLWNWFEVNHSLEPHEGVITVVLALFDTAVFTVLFWFTIKYLLGRWFPQYPTR
jgi:hypothetical protein